jgi:hypothetical protein
MKIKKTQTAVAGAVVAAAAVIAGQGAAQAVDGMGPIVYSNWDGGSSVRLSDYDFNMDGHLYDDGAWLNDSISRIVTGDTSYCFYTDANFTGRWLWLDGHQDVPVGPDFNDQISSAKPGPVTDC